MMMKRLTVLTAATVVAALATGAKAAGDSAERAALGQNEKQPFGTYLTDADGRSVYMFEADSQGGASTCYDDCAEAWPPLLTSGDPRAEGQSVDEEEIGTIRRDDGSTQVTYAGWPLYYYVQDAGPGDTQGQDVQGFGAEWYLVSPDGETIEASTDSAPEVGQ